MDLDWRDVREKYRLDLVFYCLRKISIGSDSPSFILFFWIFLSICLRMAQYARKNSIGSGSLLCTNKFDFVVLSRLSCPKVFYWIWLSIICEKFRSDGQVAEMRPRMSARPAKEELLLRFAFWVFMAISLDKFLR